MKELVTKRLQFNLFQLPQLPKKIRSLPASKTHFQIWDKPFRRRSLKLLIVSQVWSEVATRRILWAVSPWPPIFFHSWTRLNLRSDLSSTWTLRSTARPSDVSWWNSSVKSCQEQLKTSGPYAQVWGSSKNDVTQFYISFFTLRINFSISVNLGCDEVSGTNVKLSIPWLAIQVWKFI